MATKPETHTAEQPPSRLADLITGTHHGFTTEREPDMDNGYRGDGRTNISRNPSEPRRGRFAEPARPNAPTSRQTSQNPWNQGASPREARDASRPYASSGQATRRIADPAPRQSPNADRQLPRSATPRQHVDGYDRSSYGRNVPGERGQQDPDQTRNDRSAGSRSGRPASDQRRQQGRDRVPDPRIRNPRTQAARAEHPRDDYGNPARDDAESFRRHSRQSYTPMETTGDSFRNTDRYAKRRERAPFNLKVPIILAVLAVALGVGIFSWVQSLPVTVTVNGTQMEIGGEKTADYVFNQGAVHVTPGNLVDVEGALLEEGKGTPYTLTVNGESDPDATARLHNGDVLEFSDGTDVEEPSTVEDSQVIPFKTVEAGNGPLHAIVQEGADGEQTTKTGSVSGKTVTEVTTPAQDRICRRYYPDTGGEKVIALTFDDGPVGEQTSELLDVLKENGAKATFFTIGAQISGDNSAVIKRMAEEGHQVCTHSYDHAAGSGQGVNLSYMTKQEQRDEITKGLEAIEAATGTAPSTAFRSPGGNFPLEVWQNTEDLISAEIGWDIDTQDWRMPGTETIVQAIESAEPGSVILMHDGGGDRSQTIEACREAIPYLKSKGYTFVTIDELLQYPILEDGAI